MGYETQLLVGCDTNQNLSDGTFFFMVEATVDMRKMGNSELFNLPWVNHTPKEKSWYFYAPCGDGDTPITKDCYDQYFKPIPIADAITALEKDVKKFDYRRLKWALALLKAMQADSTERENLSVILWGY